MATPLFPATVIPPSQQGYSAEQGNEFIQVELDGGESRTRRDKIGATHTVRCQWELTPKEYAAVWNFFSNRLQSGVRVFRIPLLIDAPVRVEYRARLLGKPQELGQTEGLLHVIRATLEVIPNPIISFNLFCQAVSDFRVVATNNPDFSPTVDQFPIGRQIQLNNCENTVNGVFINLDGTYTITSKPNNATLVMSGAAGVNPAWNTLNGTVAQSLFAANNAGTCILLPE